MDIFSNTILEATLLYPLYITYMLSMIVALVQPKLQQWS